MPPHAPDQPIREAPSPLNRGIRTPWRIQIRNVLARLVRYNSSMWSGTYPDWESAARACRHISVAGQTRAYQHALNEVLAGRALFERDSLLQHQPVTCWPLMFALRDLQSHGVAHPTVLDVGGGLGSVFFQHRTWWTTTAPITWNVVELPEIASLGRRLVDDPQLRFFDSLEDAVRDRPPDLVIASGILPMVSDPFALLASLASIKARWTFIDRTPVASHGEGHRITRQIVPSNVYDSESPFWFFEQSRLIQQLTSHFEIAGESTGDFDDPVWVEGHFYRWRGYLLRPRS